MPIINLTWDKKTLRWECRYDYKTGEGVYEQISTCLECGGAIDNKTPYLIDNNIDTIAHKDWTTCSIMDLLAKAKDRCQSCFESIPWADYGGDTEKALNLKKLALEEYKNLHTRLVVAQIVNKSNQKLDIGAWILKIGINAGKSGIDVICGHCKKKNRFRNVEDDEQVIQCLECGHYNKIAR